jgi:hypothetical protein
MVEKNLTKSMGDFKSWAKKLKEEVENIGSACISQSQQEDKVSRTSPISSDRIFLKTDTVVSCRGCKLWKNIAFYREIHFMVRTAPCEIYTHVLLAFVIARIWFKRLPTWSVDKSLF